MKKKQTTTKQISNRRARFDYELGDSLVAGLQLSGAETKALRMGHGNLRGAYVTIIGGELWLINATISGTSGILITENDQTRSRKLLVRKSELDRLQAAKQQGRTIVPLEILTHGRYIKIRVAIGKGKKVHDKRQTIKAREASRSVQNATRSSI